MSAAPPFECDPAVICPNCLDEGWTEIPCRFCGYSDQVQLSSDKLPPKTVLDGRYLVGLVLGHEGGFGVTYKALNLVSNEKVAIKEYFPSELCGRSWGNPNVWPKPTTLHRQYFLRGLEQFEKEAQRLRGFSHPSIVKVSDYFVGNDTAYFVMPFVEGQTLAQYLDDQAGPIAFDVALDIMTPVMDALRYTHQHGLIHRDVSPENIYLTIGSRVVLLDFGAARAPIPGKGPTRILKEGFTPEEVSTGIEQGPATDVYSVAAVLYFMCVGEYVLHPAERRGGAQLARPSELGVKITRRAEDALLKALALHKKDRFDSIAAFQAELMPRHPPPPPPPTLIASGEQPVPRVPETNERNAAAFPGVALIVGLLALMLLILINAGLFFATVP